MLYMEKFDLLRCYYFTSFYLVSPVCIQMLKKNSGIWFQASVSSSFELSLHKKEKEYIKPWKLESLKAAGFQGLMMKLKVVFNKMS